MKPKLMAAMDYLKKEIADCQRDIANRKTEIAKLSREQIKDKEILAGLLKLKDIITREQEDENETRI